MHTAGIGQADRGEEARLHGQGAGVRGHAEGAGLQEVVVVEAHGLVHADERVERKAGGLRALAVAWAVDVEGWLSAPSNRETVRKTK